MKSSRAADDPLIDYTRTLEFLVGPMIAPGGSVMLDEWQYPILLSYLERIAEIGEINFQIEQCIDHRPGHSVAWNKDGTREQVDEVDRLMAELVRALGFQTFASPSDS